jgi:hypothetical protein
VRTAVLQVIFAATFGIIGGAQAQISPSFYSACPERTTIASWCPAQLSKEGWKLVYETESPRDLMDASWRYEVWIREPLAVVCALVGGRGGIRVNNCRELSEVAR